MKAKKGGENHGRLLRKRMLQVGIQTAPHKDGDDHLCREFLKRE